MQSVKSQWYIKLRESVRKSRLNKKELSKELNLSRQSLYNIIDEKHYPRRLTFEKINNYFKIRHPYLPEKKERKSFFVSK